MELREEIYNCIMDQIDISEPPTDLELQEMIHGEIHRKSGEKMISLQDQISLGRSLFHSFRRLDLLQELLDDSTITEIMVNGPDHIFIEKEGRVYPVDRGFASLQKLEDVAQQIAAISNRIVNEYTPIADARLENGARVNIVLPPVALNGPVITIRKFPDSPMTMERLLERGTLTEEAACFLKDMVKAKYNIFISGGTGAGKTTFLNALSEFIPADERIITIEDNAELQLLGKPNLVRLECRNKNTEGTGAISMRDLIRTALRMRPDRIIVGEVRGEEAVDMISALNTGHAGSLCTGHSNSPEDMLGRLVTMVLMGMQLSVEAIDRQLASGIDLILHVSRMKDKSRKLLEITEVVGYEQGKVVLNPIFTYEITEGDPSSEGGLRRVGKLKRIHKLEMAGMDPADY